MSTADGMFAGHYVAASATGRHVDRMEPIASVIPPSRTQDQSAGDHDGEGPAIGLIRRWIELSELERRVFIALAHELTISSELIEVSASGLSERFQAMATIAQAQMGHVDRIIEVAGAIDMDGEAVTLGSALESVQEGLERAIDKIQFVSTHTGRMVHALERLAHDIEEMESCAAKIEAVNHRARSLALNAAMEAERPGVPDQAFGAIVHEIRQLSIVTDLTTLEVRARIAAASDGIRSGLDVLREIAAVDLSDDLPVKQRIDCLVAALIAQHAAFQAVLTETAESSTEMGATITRLVQGMQFQDRAKQHLAQVIDTLTTLSEGAAEAQKATTDAYPGLFRPGNLDPAVLAQVIDGQRLGDMKARMLTHLLMDAPADANGSASRHGDGIELF